MAEIINCTTPTIKFTFSAVNPASLVAANLYVKGFNGTDLITKTLESAATEQKAISWTLTQAESKLLPIGKEVTIVMDWKIADGTRGRSKIGHYLVSAPGKDVII